MYTITSVVCRFLGTKYLVLLSENPLIFTFYDV